MEISGRTKHVIIKNWGLFGPVTKTMSRNPCLTVPLNQPWKTDLTCSHRVIILPVEILLPRYKASYSTTNERNCRLETPSSR